MASQPKHLRLVNRLLAGFQVRNVKAPAGHAELTRMITVNGLPRVMRLLEVLACLARRGGCQAAGLAVRSRGKL